MSENIECFKLKRLGEGPEDHFERAASWSDAIKSEAEGREIDLEDTDTSVEESL